MIIDPHALEVAALLPSDQPLDHGPDDAADNDPRLGRLNGSAEHDLSA